jgi:predicted nucleic acid-binding protein
VAFLFDTDAISETLRSRPDPGYLAWLGTAALTYQGTRLADADLQIAATALHHDLELVTGNLRHFGRIAGLRIRPLRG